MTGSLLPGRALDRYIGLGVVLVVYAAIILSAPGHVVGWFTAGAVFGFLVCFIAFVRGWL